VPQMQSHWDAWFDMPSQWTPFWLCTGEPTVAQRRPEAAVQTHVPHTEA